MPSTSTTGFGPSATRTPWAIPRLWPGSPTKVNVRFIATLPMGDHFSHDFYTSEWGTLGAAIVNPIDGDESLIVVSMAPAYNAFTRESGSPSRRECIGSVHRLISDLARLVGRQSRVIAAGDWAINPGWSTHTTPIWNEREARHFQTAFDRMQALGFRQVMPEGRRSDRGDVVTFRSIGATPAQAWAQADYVFATENIPTACRWTPSTVLTTGARATTAASSLTLTEPRPSTVPPLPIASGGSGGFTQAAHQRDPASPVAH